MRLRGSVLIVILGLLAVLAVVGIAFVTMSSIESNTASNFALQAQFDLAADGAVDYVCQALIRDVWEYDTKPSGTGSTFRTYTGYLLTGRFGTIPWDFPSNVLSVDPANPTQDAFLATSWSNPTQTTIPAFSFRAVAPTIKPYNLGTWGGGTDGKTAYPGTGVPGSGTDGSPNNLGIPTGTQVLWYSPQNGLWIPELACPFENGVIRVSVTVQDHAAMVNVNAHGSPTAGSGPWQPYGAAAGKGAFISDLSPVGVSTWLTSLTLANIPKLLDGTLTPPGRWGTNNMPGNKRLGEIFIQNPGAGSTSINGSASGSMDRPFGLDDEFELRRLTGTYATSRLEQIIVASLDSTPALNTTATVTSRLGLTTVGWNAEVVPAQSGCITKCDLNLASDQQAGGNFEDLLDSGGVLRLSTNQKMSKQFAANVYSFAERYSQPTTSGNYFRELSAGLYGARRQLILSQVRVQVAPASPNDTWTVRVQVFAPWANDYAGDTKNGMDSRAYRIKCYFGGTVKTMNGGVVGVGNQIPGKSIWDKQEIYTDLGKGKTLDKIELEVTGPGVVDRVPLSIPSTAAQTVHKYRPFGVYDEPRAADDTDPKSVVTVVYVKGWQTLVGSPDWTKPQGDLTAIAPGQGIPIRFPHSVPRYDATGDDAWVCGRKTAGGVDGQGPLPPYWNMSGSGDPGSQKPEHRGKFKAFLRVADLNQVLCPTDADAAAGYWPWIVRVADLSGAPAAPPTPAQETQVKWDWWPASSPVELTPYTLPLYDSSTSIRNYRRYNGANVFCVDSPWYDSFDNDGDGVKDTVDDKGTPKDSLGEHGRFCGKEIRVAGRININTATDQALRALGESLAGGNETAYTPIAAARGVTGFRSPVEILGKSITVPLPGTFYGGPLEKRDYPYTLISNIATVRSDTFSIYGTVQYLQLLKGYNQAAATTSLADIKIIRTRRFWALVDRSPALNFKPDSTNFVRPRVMNFQWLD